VSIVESRAALALLALGVLASIVLTFLPILVAGMVGQFHWDDTRAGWLASADMLGSAVASLLAMRRVARLPWRTMALAAIAVAIAGNVASIWASGLASLLAARFVTGFGNGIVLTLAFAGLCHSRSPARFFGAYTFAQLALQTLALSVAPRIIEAYGMSGIYLTLAGVSAASAVLVPFIPAALHSEVSQAPAAGSRVRLTIGAQAIYFLAPAAAWAYLERIGQNFALDMAQVGTALGISSIAGIAGAGSVIALGTRFGILMPMAVGTALSIVATLLFMDGPGFGVYLAAACGFNFAWNFTFPFQMGAISQLDRSGSVATLSLLAQLCALGLGPLLASFVLGAAGYEGVLWTCIALYALSLFMFHLGAALQPRALGVKLG
jgi:predicted MFS family arabinose efflux permease